MNTYRKEQWNRLSDEIKWAIWTLKNNGIRASEYLELSPYANDMDKEYKATIEKLDKTKKDKYYSMASKLREMWPMGDKVIVDKDGKETRIPWRDSAENISKRLKKMLEKRKLDNMNEEEILRCARVYLSRYEESNKYMKVLNYFILKEETVAGKKVLTSRLADMLDSKNDAENLIEDTNEKNLDYGETLG